MNIHDQLDWLEQFVQDFGDHREIHNLARKRFYGNIVLNFASGRVKQLNRNESIMPVRHYSDKEDGNGKE